jgi:hypothetical protein
LTTSITGNDVFPLGSNGGIGQKELDLPEDIVTFTAIIKVVQPDRTTVEYHLTISVVPKPKDTIL